MKKKNVSKGVKKYLAIMENFVWLNSLFFLLLTLFYAYMTIVVTDFKTNIKSDQNIPVIVWWTPFSGEYEKIRDCNLGKCLFTENRSYDLHNLTYMFYGTFFTTDDLPLPRNIGSWWALLHEESPKNQPLFNHKDVISLFNLTSTFRSESDMPLTLFYLQNIEVLKSLKYFVSTENKNKLLNKLSPVIYLQSDCNPPSERDLFVNELSKYIQIDSYGRCLNNRSLPENLIGIDRMNDESILKLISKYKFTLALENYSCNDYITEKIWRPLSVGSVPLYWGSPSIHMWIPNEKSIIDVRNYSSPYKLSLIITEILNNDSLYESYLEHKIKTIISNTQLINTIAERKWGINEEQFTKGTFVEHFECYVCDKILERNVMNDNIRIAKENHYGCPAPKTVLGNIINERSSWLDAWYIAEAEAAVLSSLVSNRSAIFDRHYYSEQILKYLNNV